MVLGVVLFGVARSVVSDVFMLMNVKTEEA